MNSVDLFARNFLAIYFTIVGLHYAVRSYALRKRTGLRYIGYGPRLSAAWWNRHIFNFFRASILIICASRVFTDVDRWLGIIQPLYQSLVMVTGIGLMLLSSVIIEYVHSYMNQDWRTGIVESETKQQLIVGGPFAKSRNPLFIGILTGQLGFFLAIPSLFSLVCLTTGAVVIFKQARAEELALCRQFGEAYDVYKRQVPRWL